MNRVTGILAVSLLSLTAMAFGQNTTHPAEPPAPKTEQLQPGNGAGFSAESLGLSANVSVVPAWSVGWNYIHPQNCEVYYSGGYPYLYVYAQEGGYFWTSDTGFQTLISPACQTGNWLAFYVYNSSNNWSNVWSYNYK